MAILVKSKGHSGAETVSHVGFRAGTLIRLSLQIRCLTRLAENGLEIF